MAVIIDAGLCPANHDCPLVDVCPVGAIIQTGGTGLPEVDAEACVECGLCVEACGKSAVRME